MTHDPQSTRDDALEYDHTLGPDWRCYSTGTPGTVYCQNIRTGLIRIESVPSPAVPLVFPPSVYPPLPGNSYD